MNRFGTIYPFIESDEETFLYGRHVANFEFLKALLRYGSFDEYHLFCLTPNHAALTHKKLLSLDIDTRQKAKVTIFLYNELLHRIHTTEYAVFHLGGWGFFFSSLVYLRNEHALNRFPITGIIHSLNSMDTPLNAMKLMYSPHESFDAVICSSEAGRTVFTNTTARAARLLPGAGNLSFRGELPVIALGVDEETFHPRDRAQCRQKLGIPPDAVMVLSIGRLTPSIKADVFPLLLQYRSAAGRLHGKRSLLVIGGGGSAPEIAMVKSMIHELHLDESVKLLPNFKDELKPLLYGAADIYISLSDNLQETFGLSIVEAMLSGLPVIASDFDGYKELVVHGETGYKIPVRWPRQLDIAELSDIMNFSTMQLLIAQATVVDCEILDQTLCNCMNDAELCARLGANGRKRALDTYTWSKVLRRYEELWERLHRRSLDGAAAPVLQNPFKHELLEVFSHYPSSCLEQTDTIAITAFGKECLASNTFPSCYTDVTLCLDRSLLARILEKAATGALSCDELGRQVENSGGGSIVFTILWMAKYGLIKIDKK